MRSLLPPIGWVSDGPGTERSEST